MKPLVTIDDFNKLDLRVGTIVEALRVEGADKLLKLHVDVGEKEPRQILAGIAHFVGEPDSLRGLQCAFVVNMAPRVLRGLESNGMLLAASTDDGAFALLTPSTPLSPGARIR